MWFFQRHLLFESQHVLHDVLLEVVLRTSYEESPAAGRQVEKHILQATRSIWKEVAQILYINRWRNLFFIVLSSHGGIQFEGIREQF